MRENLNPKDFVVDFRIIDVSGIVVLDGRGGLVGVDSYSREVRDFTCLPREPVCPTPDVRAKGT